MPAGRSGLLGIVIAVIGLQPVIHVGTAAAARPRQDVVRQLQDANARLRDANTELRALSSDVEALSSEVRRGVDAAEPDLLRRLGDIAAVLGILAAAAAVWFTGRSLRVAEDALEPARRSAAAAVEQAEAAMTQTETAVRPLLIEVRPYAPATPDLGGRRDDETGRPIYQLLYPGDDDAIVWDARRTHVDWRDGKPIKVSLVVRNVGAGLALLDDSVTVVVSGAPAELAAVHVRYPRLAPNETTRVNAVLREPAQGQDGKITVTLSYRSLSGAFMETARIHIATRESRAWTAQHGRSWDVVDIEYRSEAQ